MKKSEEKIFADFIKKNEQRAKSTLCSKFPVLSEENIKDIMQDALLVLHKNIEEGKVDGPQYPYYLKICFNLGLKAVNKSSKYMVVGIGDTEVMQKDTVSMYKVECILQVSDEQDSVISEKKQLVHEALEEMPTKCKDLLWSFYADELSWATIAQQFGMKNADSAKSQASRCRRSFKEKYNTLRLRYNGE